MQLLSDGGYFDELDKESASLTLFKKHFITMNTLYQLQNYYRDKGQYLEVSALSIFRHPNVSECALGSEIVEVDEKVGAYYLDWDNFESATDDSVAELLKSFWQKYEAYNSKEGAYHALGLNESATWAEVQTQYRKLAKLHHPDAGGESGKFIEIRSAYEQIKRLQS